MKLFRNKNTKQPDNLFPVVISPAKAQFVMEVDEQGQVSMKWVEGSHNITKQNMMVALLRMRDTLLIEVAAEQSKPTPED